MSTVRQMLYSICSNPDSFHALTSSSSRTEELKSRLVEVQVNYENPLKRLDASKDENVWEA